MGFKARKAIVTGAANGIGKQIGKQLAAGGAIVLILDFDEEASKTAVADIEDMGGKAECYNIDLSSIDSVKDVSDAILAKHDVVDILINCAGVYGITPVDRITEREWDTEHSINLKSQFFLIQQLLPAMIAQHYGKIVNLSSIAGRNGGVEAGITYSSSKAGVIGMTRGLAARLAPEGVYVNCVAPGPTMTEMFNGLSEAQQEGVKSHIPLRRFGKPEDIANAVEFLASDKAGFITGVVLDVNGGMYLG